MGTLHIAPGGSAGGSLLRALRDAGRDDQLLCFWDDLSCGPISDDNPATRAAWWASFYEPSEVQAALAEFWRRVETTDDRLLVWFGRHSASEHAFFLAWTDRLGDRPYDIIDVSGRHLPLRQRDGSVVQSRPVQAVSLVQAESLRLLLGEERPVTGEERAGGRSRWRQLQAENAPFRIVTETGLVSAPIDCFDPLLLANARPQWQKVARLVGETMGLCGGPCLQIHDYLTLVARIVALVEAGRLVAEGDPWDMSSRIRLPA